MSAQFIPDPERVTATEVRYWQHVGPPPRPLSDSDLASSEARHMALWVRAPGKSTFLQKARAYLEAAPTPEEREARKKALYLHLYGHVTGGLSQNGVVPPLDLPSDSSRTRE